MGGRGESVMGVWREGGGGERRTDLNDDEREMNK